ncbi:fungal cellulose binding domain-containing protein [Colletotrichum melonis]|uniref:lytic cellulose monooxygenase (C4-dehydrogenating) n=1 Tax=Colletotrichum melonis TaxID=1209925 RepID=A0AAI9XFR9_9PEZI|nr:fungal cellulose binding domain-containing protein [Colletotrichum melonis]
MLGAMYRRPVNSRSNPTSHRCRSQEHVDVVPSLSSSFFRVSSCSKYTLVFSDQTQPNGSDAMKFFTAAAVLSAAVSEVSGHYIFQQLSVGSTKYDVFQHIRKNTNYNSPVTDLASNDLRCNVGGASGAQTTVVNVKPGDAFTFTLDTAVYHQGPISLFLSKAPSHVQDYDGSGKWAKFKDFLPTFSNGQATWPMRQTYEYKIPTCLPNGEYLLRVHQLGIHNPYPAGIPQFYISCAQINVTGSTASASSFAPTLSIPGAFKDTDPGYTVNVSVLPVIYQPGFTSYVAPGGAEVSLRTYMA